MTWNALVGRRHLESVRSASDDWAGRPTGETSPTGVSGWSPSGDGVGTRVGAPAVERREGKIAPYGV